MSSVTSINNYMKEQQFRKLNAMAAKKDVFVTRNGNMEKMSVYNLVVGDVVKVDTGEILSVDGIVFAASKMTAD